MMQYEFSSLQALAKFLDSLGEDAAERGEKQQSRSIRRDRAFAEAAAFHRAAAIVRATKLTEEVK